jgi:beta-glucanase (GH16 family)
VSEVVILPENIAPMPESYSFSLVAAGPGGSATTRTLTVGVPTFVPPTTEGPWHVDFGDAFPGKVVNKAHWNTCYPWGTPAGCTNFGNTELEWYLPSQVRVSENTLHLVAREQATAGKSATGSPMTYGWRSGMVTSYKKFAFTYGYVQVSAEIEWYPGFWMASWLHTETGATFPEVDIEESWGSGKGRVLQGAHVGANAKTIIGAWTANLGPGFHNYGLDWEKHSLTWYVDGKCVPALHSTAPHKCFSVVQNVPAQPMYLIANFAIDGDTFWHNAPTAATPHTGSFNVKYIRVWQHR